MEAKILEQVKRMIAGEVNTLRNQLLNFRRWNKQDSVTDQFSPITGASQQIGFFGTNKIAKPTVTGSKGGNAALTSLMTALSNLGLIKDSTT